MHAIPDIVYQPASNIVAAQKNDDSEKSEPRLSRYPRILWLVGMLILLPIDFIRLPLNMIMMDFWVLMALPVFWLLFIRSKQVINMSYTVPMCLILIASFISTIAAPVPRNSFVVILKECYAFVWFLTLVAVISKLHSGNLRRILIVWIGVVFLHGAIMVAQFASPAFWRFIIGLGGRVNEYELYRPSGLFANANSAAFFQLLGFVPLVLASSSKRVTLILGILLLSTMLVTGSMGATIAFIAGLTVALIAISISGHVGSIVKVFVQLAIILYLFGGLLFFVIKQNPRYQEHFEHILINRAERSSGGRFHLWQRGMDAFIDHSGVLWGVGPENFRVVDGKNKQLHNDFIAFSVERGLLGGLALVLFGVIAMGRAFRLFQLSQKGQTDLKQVVFIAAIVAIMIESLTHQIFHFREMWIVLALQEVMIFKLKFPNNEG